MRRVVLIILALVLAGGATLGGAAIVTPIFKRAEQEKVKVEPKPETADKPVVHERRVLVFAAPKQAGEHVNSNTDLTIALLPESQVPSDAFSSSDVSSDPIARNRIDGWEILKPVTAGTPVAQSMLKEVKPEPKVETPVIRGNDADAAFLETLENDPAIVLFTEEQLSGLRLRADVIVDIMVESPAAGFGDGTWVGRETIVTGATLRATSLDVNGHGATPVFYAKLSQKEADKVRAAQAIANGHLKVEPHRDARALPPVGHVCVGPENNQVCFEALPEDQMFIPADAPVEEQAAPEAQK